ncbi:MAG: condensation domain-containing protein [Actinomycetota bacterium]|nr:condensation domain-containing protein [Actinomycetota bacterium]
MPRRGGAVPLTTLPDLLRKAAQAAPERVAVAVEGERGLTYGDWDEQSSAMARGLRCAGVRCGDRVALLSDPTGWSKYAVTYLAVHKAAAVAVPLVAGLGEIELGRVIGDLRPSAIVAAPGLAPGDGSVPVLDPAEVEDQGDDAPPARPPRPPEVGEILCVSHPLSRPVYVSRSDRALLDGPSLTFGAAAGSPSLLHAFPVGTLAGQDALCAALVPTPGRSVVLADLDPDRLCALLAAQAIGTCALHPSMARALVDTGATARHDLSGVGGLVLASGRVSPALLVDLSAAFPRAALRLVDVLGHLPGLRTVFAHDRSRPGSVGRPVDGTAVVVTDEAGRPVNGGEIGRVRVRDGDGDGATGDLGYVDDSGALYVVAAGSDVVRCRRATVVRAEVESILREHPAVADAAVLGMPHDDSGGRLTTAVVLASPVSAPELQELAQWRLGEEKVPETVSFVDEIPRTDSGTVRRAQLRRHLGLPSRGGERVEAPAPLQETVAAVWRRVLRREDIGPADDFFELGGHGSAAATMLGLLEDALEVPLPVSTFLEAPTVGGLARALERLVSRGGGDPPAAPVAFSQEGMLWHELFAPGCQNLPGLARRYRGPLDVAALGRALDEIMRRHDALRTTFELRDGRPVQVVHAHRPLDLAVRDLSSLAPGEREVHVDRLVAEAGRAPFDLVAGPLFEPTLLRLADHDHVLVIRTHHSVFDDWSVGVFRRELAALYTAYAQGESSPLPELALQFAQLCRRQRRELAGPAGTRELEFWRRELAGAPLITQLPVHDPQLPEGAPQATGQPVLLSLPPEVCDRLRMLARRERVTVFMTLLAAFGVLVQHRTGQDDLLLATVVANRNATELEGPIGCFTKKVPIRLRLDGDPTFAEILRRARTALLGALSHQDLPFETVIGDVLGAPATAHGLVPHVAIMFQGVTPTEDLVMPGLETSGFETSTTAPRAHFMARGDDGPGDEGVGEDVHAVPWGAGLYLGTFVILSVADSADGLSCIARGAFHAPAVRELLDGFAALLGEVADEPARRLSQLAVGVQPPPSSDGQVDLRGSRVELARMASALAECPGVRDVAVTLERDEHGEPALVASVVPDGRPPTLTDLRTFLWSRLPGYAWPSAMVVVGSLAAAQEARLSVDESLLSTLWGEVLGVERAAPAESYSQAFSFTRALARAREAGVPVPGEHVARNRTVRTLAAALAARRHRL